MREGSWMIVHCPKTNQYLMGKRSAKSRNPGTWDFFGGNVDTKNESPLEAVIREFHEEMGYGIFPAKITYLTTLVNKRMIHVFRIKIKSDVRLPFNKKEHSKVKWFPVDKLPSNVNAPTKRIFKWLKQSQNLVK